MSEVVNERLEKLKGVFSNSENSSNFRYVSYYVLAVFIIYLVFQKQFVVWKNILFILIPIASIVLILIKRYSAAILTTVIGFSSILRIQIIPNLIDATTGKYMPADPDALAFLRYVKVILENGSLPSIDPLRYFPQGYSNLAEFSFLSYVIAYWFKIVSFFSSKVTIELIDITYPAVAFAIAMVFFYLLAKRLTNTNIALLSTTILSVIPAFLFRTMSGVSDKEALGMALMFGAMYFYICSWQNKNQKKSSFLAALSGIFTGMLGLTWGGVSFLFIIFAVFNLTQIIINRFNKKDFYSYSLWAIVSIIILNMFYPSRFSFNVFLTSLTTLIMIGVFFFSLIHFLLIHLKLFGLYNKFKEKFPPWVISGAITVVFGFAALTLMYGSTFITDRVADTLHSLSKPFGGSRWALTVAESNQPYFTGGSFSLVNELNNSKYFIVLFIAGLIAMFYSIIKDLKNYKIVSAILFTLFTLGVLLSRYSANSKFNGETTISQITYFGSLAGLFIMLCLASFLLFRKNKELFEKLQNSNREYMFIIVLFFLMAIAARSAIRLFIVFAPVISLTASFMMLEIYNYLKEKLKDQKDSFFKIIITVVLILFILTITWPFGSNVSSIPVVGKLPIINQDGLIIKSAKISLGNSRGTGSVFNGQWQSAGDWVRKNLPEDAVFAHWWDYGYLVQTGFERATLTDGGNAIGSRNYFSGRHLMTAQNSTEALEYMKTYGATHLLFIADEIGKYPAYSSIGSDANYDRYSQITSFSLDQSQTQETRDTTILVYKGAALVEDDLNVNGQTYSACTAGVALVKLPISNDGESIGAPTAVIAYQGRPIEVPLGCVSIGDKAYKFEDAPLKGCLKLMPVIQNNKVVDQLGSALYLSPRVANSLFGRLYLLNEDIEGFKLVYKDEGIPLSFYEGRLIGPLKIWEVDYSDDNIRIVPEYLRPELPDPRVNLVRRDFCENKI